MSVDAFTTFFTEPLSSVGVFSTEEKKKPPKVIYTLAKTIILEDLGAFNAHCFGINSPLASALFYHDDEDHFMETPCYVKTSNRVYRVVLLSIIEDEENKPLVFMTRLQQEELALSDSSIVLRTFDLKTGPAYQLDSLEVRLHCLPNKDEQQEPLVMRLHLLTKEEITKRIKTFCDDLVLHNGQRLFGIFDNQKAISAIVKFGKNDFSASAHENQKEFGLITKKTKLSFVYETEKIVMVENTFVSAKGVLFHLTVDDKSMQRYHNSGADHIKESLLLDQDKLRERLQALLGSRPICLGQTLTLDYKGHKISLYAERIDRTSLGIHSLNQETTLTPYEISLAQIQFKIQSPNVFLGKNKPVNPEKCSLVVLKRIMTSSPLDQDGPSWISLDDLAKVVIGQVAVNGQILRVSLSDGDYLVAPTFIPAPSSQDFPADQLYLIRENVSCRTSAEIKSLSTSVRYPLQSLRATIRPKSQTKTSILSEDDKTSNAANVELTDLLDELHKIVYPIYEKAILSVTVKGVTIPLEITSLEPQQLQDKSPETSSDGKAEKRFSEPWLGKIIPGITVIEISNEKKVSGISVRRKDEPVLDRAIFLKGLKNSLGGLDDVFEEITDLISQSWGEMRKEAVSRGIQPARGVLLYGPPGTGKTLIGRMIAKLLNCKNLIMISGTDVFNKWVGETEKAIRALFKDAQTDWELLGEKSELHIIMIDEIDGLLPDRGRNHISQHTIGVVNTFLAKMDGFDQMHNLFIIGLTNRLDDIDPAVRRHGRFGKQIEIGLPTARGRRDIFQIHTKPCKDSGLLHDDIDFDFLAKATKNVSGAEIRGICEDAASLSVARLGKLQLPDAERKVHPFRMVTMEDFNTVLNRRGFKAPQEGRQGEQTPLMQHPKSKCCTIL